MKTNEQIRDEFRKKGIDIEVTVVADVVDNHSKHTGKYRYLISHWDESGALIANYYSPTIYPSYHMAEDEAIIFINSNIV
jgi:hypothetical protein